MSVKELAFKDECNPGEELIFRFENDTLFLLAYKDDKCPYYFTRDEAHLLMLYLQEHLKA